MGPWHVFFDTPELTCRPPEHRHGLWGKVAIPDQLERTGSRAYISQLCVDELAWQGVRNAGSMHARLQAIDRYIGIPGGMSLPPLRDDVTDAAGLRRGAAQCLPSWLTIVPTDSMPLTTLLDWSTQRRLPFRGNSNPTGFHDAAVFLSSLLYAQAHGLSPCLFVTSNHAGFTVEGVRALGRESGAEWDVIDGVADLVAFLADPELAAVVRAAFADKEVFKRALSTMALSDIVERVSHDLNLIDPIHVCALEVSDPYVHLVDPARVGADSRIDFRLSATVLLRAIKASSAHPPRSLSRSLERLVVDVSGQGAVTVEHRNIAGEPRILGMVVDAITPMW